MSLSLRRSTIAAAGSLLLMMATASGAVQAPPQFRSTVELVQLQVGVADRNGDFPTGLQPDQFVVRVNGEERPVQVAYEVDLRQGPEDSGAVIVGGTAEPRARSSAPVAARRHFLIFFDFAFTSRRGVLEARRSALDFLDRMVHPEDLVGVTTADRFGIKLLAPFTSDHAAAREAVATLGLADATDLVSSTSGIENSVEQALLELIETRAGDDGGVGAALEGANYRDYVASVANYQNQLQAFGEMLQAIEGRKHVLFFSRGFDDQVLTGQTLGQMGDASDARAQDPIGIMEAEPEMLYGTAEIRGNMTELVDMFRRADAAIHAIDTSGAGANVDATSDRLGGGTEGSVYADLSQGFDSQSLGFRNGHQALTALAAGTDGTLHLNLNDFEIALADIERRTAAFYMIGYAKHPDDPATVDIEVRVRVPGVKVVSAPRALTPPPDFMDLNEAQRQLQLAEFLNDDVDRRDIGFDSQVVAYPEADGSARVAVLMEISGLELDAISGRRDDGRLQFEIAAFALDDQDTVLDEVRRRINLDMEQLRAGGPLYEQSLRYSDLLDVPAGGHRVRLLVRESEVGLLSSRTMRFWVEPPGEEIRVMRPLIVRGLGAAAPDDETFDPIALNGRRLSFAAGPVLRPGELFRLLVVAYHLPRDAASGDVLAGLGLEAVDADGEPHRLTEFEITGSAYDQANDLTQLLIEARFPDGVPSGAGQLWARFADRTTGRRVEEQTGIYVQGR